MISISNVIAKLKKPRLQDILIEVFLASMIVVGWDITWDFVEERLEACRRNAALFSALEAELIINLHALRHNYDVINQDRESFSKLKVKGASMLHFDTNALKWAQQNIPSEIFPQRDIITLAYGGLHGTNQDIAQRNLFLNEHYNASLHDPATGAFFIEEMKSRDQVVEDDQRIVSRQLANLATLLLSLQPRSGIRKIFGCSEVPRSFVTIH